MLNLPLALPDGPEEDLSGEPILAGLLTPFFADIWLKVVLLLVTSNVNKIVSRGSLLHMKRTNLEQNGKRIFERVFFVVFQYTVCTSVRNSSRRCMISRHKHELEGFWRSFLWLFTDSRFQVPSSKFQVPSSKFQVPSSKKKTRTFCNKNLIILRKRRYIFFQFFFTLALRTHTLRVRTLAFGKNSWCVVSG